MISARTKSALAQAKLRGVKLGGDRGNLLAVAAAGRQVSAARRSAQADAYATDIQPDIEAVRARFITHRSGRERDVRHHSVLSRRGSGSGSLSTDLRRVRVMKRALTP